MSLDGFLRYGECMASDQREEQHSPCLRVLPAASSIQPFSVGQTVVQPVAGLHGGRSGLPLRRSCRRVAVIVNPAPVGFEDAWLRGMLRSPGGMVRRGCPWGFICGACAQSRGLQGEAGVEEGLSFLEGERDPVQPGVDPSEQRRDADRQLLSFLGRLLRQDAPQQVHDSRFGVPPGITVPAAFLAGHGHDLYPLRGQEVGQGRHCDCRACLCQPVLRT